MNVNATAKMEDIRQEPTQSCTSAPPRAGDPPSHPCDRPPHRVDERYRRASLGLAWLLDWVFAMVRGARHRARVCTSANQRGRSATRTPRRPSNNQDLRSRQTHRAGGHADDGRPWLCDRIRHGKPRPALACATDLRRQQRDSTRNHQRVIGPKMPTRASGRPHPAEPEKAGWSRPGCAIGRLTRRRQTLRPY